MNPSHGAPFRGFRDDSESPFFCAAGHTPEETWDISVNRLAQLLVKLGPVAKSRPIEMSPELLCSWHREIFGELFPEDGYNDLEFASRAARRRGWESLSPTPTNISRSPTPRSSATLEALDGRPILEP